MEDTTGRSSKEFVIEHEVPKDLISAAGVKKGERYRVSFTNKCLGTRWWMFGDLQDERLKDVRFVTRGGQKAEENEGRDEVGRWYKGEIPNELALAIEDEIKGVVEFEII